MRTDKYFLAGHSIPSRRHYPRVETPNEVWVYWHCNGREDTSQVRDLSMGGLFVETEEARMWTRRSGLTFLFRKDKSGPKLLSGM
jgi:hypothetical protein